MRFSLILAFLLLISFSSATDVTTCGILTTHNTVYELIENISVVSNDNCWDIYAENTTFVCNGNIINQSGAGNSIIIDRNNNTITNCTFYIKSEGISAVRIRNTTQNNILSNLTVNLTSINFAFIIENGSSNNTIANNTVNASSSGAIFTVANESTYTQKTMFSDNNTILNNSINSTSSAVAIFIGTNATNTLSTQNNISARTWVRSYNISNYFNDSSKGNIYYNSSGAAAWDTYDITATLGNWANGGTDRPFNASNTPNNWSGEGNDSHPWTETLIPGYIDNCQTLSTANTIYTLAASPPQNASTCFTVSAENITLNCSGYTITGDNTSTHYGVYSTQFNTTVKNCIINNFSTGIFIDGDAADYANITNNTINLTYKTSCSYLTGVCNAIFLNGADNAQIKENTVNAYQSAINFYSNANYNNISYNNATANTEAISLSTSCNNTVSYNNASSIVGYTIYLRPSSNNNTISYNNATSANDHSIHLATSINNNISHNRLNTTGDDFGLYLSGSDNNRIDNNTIYAKDYYGIYLTASDGNNITNNDVETDDDRGIYLTGSTNNSVINNTIDVADSQGITLTASSNNNTVNYNNITLDDNGIFILTASSNNVSYNYISASALNGIQLRTNSHDNIISYNNATAGNIYAIHVYQSNNNTIDNNNATSTNNNAIRLWTSSNNNITNNRALGADNGITLENHSNENNISYNNATASDLNAFQLNNFSNNNNISYNNFSATNNRGVYIRLSANNNIFTNNTINSTALNAIKITVSAGNNTFYYNNISGDVWINDENESNYYNTTGAGNIYYFSNGTASWEVYNTVDTDADNWADWGAQVPLNASVSVWTGLGNDSFPFSEATDSCNLVYETNLDLWINSTDQCVFDNEYVDMGNGGIYFVDNGNITFRECELDLSYYMRKAGDTGIWTDKWRNDSTNITFN